VSIPHWSETPGSIPAAVLGGLALGAGGRLTKNIMDLMRRGPTESPISITPDTEPVTQIPVAISPEEAKSLEQRGIKVRRVHKEAATKEASPSFVGGMGLGALATGAAYGGWTVADKIINSIRKRQAQGDVESVRNRLEGLLDATPDDRDIQLVKQMKRAEDMMVAQLKEASIGGVADWVAGQTLGPGLGVAAGAGLTLAALAAYNNAKRNSIHGEKARALKGLLSKRPTETSFLAMEPVLVDRGARASDIAEEAPGLRAGAPSEEAARF